MANMWYVSPDTEKLDLHYNGTPFWITIKKQLTVGEKRKLETAGFRGMTSPQGASRRDERATTIDINWQAISFARAEMYLVDWSLADDRGMRLSLQNKRDALEQLHPEVFEVIENAISKYVEAAEEAKKARTGSVSGEPGPSETSA